MNDLPLFPLNTVLFPGMPLNLHIFEPRYREMIDLCIDTQQPFGVVLIEEGQEALGPLARPHPIGCTAQIVHVERLDDGRMNITAIGMERFQIHQLHHDRSYLVGTVDMLPLGSDDPARMERAGNRLRPWVERYLSVLAEATDSDAFDPAGLPTDPLALAHLAAAVVQIPAEQKQALLAAAQASELLTSVRAIYRREVALLNAIVSHPPADEEGLFSPN